MYCMEVMGNQRTPSCLKWLHDVLHVCSILNEEEGETGRTGATHEGDSGIHVALFATCAMVFGAASRVAVG